MNAPPYRLYRSSRQGWLAGVCAGIAEYFGVDVRLVRLMWTMGLVFFTLPTLFAYVAMIFLVPRRPSSLYESPDEERLRRAVHLSPHRTLENAALTLRDAEQRMARLEAAVLSEEFQLRRKFRDIG